MQNLYSGLARVLAGAIFGFFLGISFGFVAGVIEVMMAVTFSPRAFPVMEALAFGAAVGLTIGALIGDIAAWSLRSVFGKPSNSFRMASAGAILGLGAGTLAQVWMWAHGLPPTYWLSMAFAGTSAGAVAGVVYGTLVGARAQEEPAEPEGDERSKLWSEFIRTKLPDSGREKGAAFPGSSEARIDKSVPSHAPIARLTHRLLAWILDVALIGVLGQIIGFTFYSLLLQIGPYGRLIGIVLTWSYFGILNSSLGGGQTLGKRLIQIAVRDSQNKPISLARSLLRITIVASPVILNAWTLPLFQVGVLMWFQAVVVFGFAVVLLYTMVFNHKTHQGLHDLICDTYVVDLSGKPVEAIPRTGRVHYAVSIALFALVTLAVSFSVYNSAFTGGRQQTSALYNVSQALQADSRFHNASVGVNQIYSTGGKRIRRLQVNVWYKGSLPAREEAGNLRTSIAKTILGAAENIEEFDVLSITITSGYDIGVAVGYVAAEDNQEPEIWRRRVGFAESK